MQNSWILIPYINMDMPKYMHLGWLFLQCLQGADPIVLADELQSTETTPFSSSGRTGWDTMKNAGQEEEVSVVVLK